MPENPIMRYFAFSHLPEKLQAKSKPIATLAEQMNAELPDGPEKSAGLRKLLEAKDCFVRASLALLVIAALLFAGGCQSAPQTERSATGGDKTGSTPSTVVVANGQTYNYFFSQPPSTQPASDIHGTATFTQTVSGVTSDNKAGTAGQTRGGDLGSQTSSPTQTTSPQTSIPINITPGAGGLSVPGSAAPAVSLPVAK